MVAVRHDDEKAEEEENENQGEPSRPRGQAKFGTRSEEVLASEEILAWEAARARATEGENLEGGEAASPRIPFQS